MGKDFLRMKHITLCPIQRTLIDKSLLSRGEVEWVDRYHAEVLQKLGGLVEGDTKAWLEDACKPL